MVNQEPFKEVSEIHALSAISGQQPAVWESYTHRIHRTEGSILPLPLFIAAI